MHWLVNRPDLTYRYIVDPVTQRRDCKVLCMKGSYLTNVPVKPSRWLWMYSSLPCFHTVGYVTEIKGACPLYPFPLLGGCCTKRRLGLRLIYSISLFHQNKISGSRKKRNIINKLINTLTMNEDRQLSVTYNTQQYNYEHNKIIFKCRMV